MNKDKNLEQIYEEMRKCSYPEIGYDIFKDVTPICKRKIDIFIAQFTQNLHIESFTENDPNIVFFNKQIKNGFKDKYEDDINNKKFFCVVNYYVSDFFIKHLEDIILQKTYFKQSIDKLKEIKEKIEKQPKKLICHLKFEDVLGRLDLTKDVKNCAYKVFGFVVRSIRYSLRKRAFNISCVYYLVSKMEKERNIIYNKIIKNELNNIDFLNEQYSDVQQNKNYDIIYNY